MQRRAAAVYFVLFVALAGGAYAFIQVGATAPEVNLDGPTYTQGDSFSVDGRTYNVTKAEAVVEEGDGHGGGGGFVREGELSWFNESFMATGTVENDSTIPWRDSYTVDVEDENATYLTLVSQSNTSRELYIREAESFHYVDESATTTLDSIDADGVNVSVARTAMVANNSTVSYNDTDHRVDIPSEGNVTLRNSQDVNQTVNFTVGDEFDYAAEGVTTTITAAADGNVTLGWNESARIDNGSTITVETHFETPSEFGNESATLRKVEDVTAIAQNDSEAQDVSENGEYILKQDGSFVDNSTYLPPESTITVTVDDGFYFPEATATNGTTTVKNIESAAVTVTWNSPKDVPIELSEGGNVTLNGQQYFAHFTSNESVQVLPADQYYSSYKQQQSDIDAHQRRINGLWGIVLISVFASLVLVSAAYLPNKS